MYSPHPAFSLSAIAVWVLVYYQVPLFKYLIVVHVAKIRKRLQTNAICCRYLTFCSKEGNDSNGCFVRRFCLHSSYSLKHLLLTTFPFESLVRTIYNPDEGSDSNFCPLIEKYVFVTCSGIISFTLDTVSCPTKQSST